MQYLLLFYPMRKLRNIGVNILALAFSFGVGCSTGGGGKGRPQAILPQEIPHELQKKFEVKELEVDPTLQEKAKDASSQVLSQGLTSAKSSASKKAVQSTPRPLRVAPRSSKKGLMIPNRRVENDPIWENEVLTYEVTYFGASAGILKTKVLPSKVMNGRKVYHLVGEIKSSKVFSLFYKVDDSVESFLDYEGLFSHRFHLLLNQSNQTRDALELFDSETMKSYYWNRLNHVKKGYSEEKGYHPMEFPFPQDSFSSIYFLRTIPLEVGKTITVPIVSEAKNWQAVIHVLRKETIDTPMGKMGAVVISPKTKFQGVMKQNEKNSFIWLSDDDRRFILRIEAEVKVGTVVIKLIEVQKGDPPQT